MPLVKNTETTISEEEYLDGELISELKHEYIDGFVYAMAGASAKHNSICMNIANSLFNELKKRGSPCRVFSSDMKVKISDLINSFFYPDVMVVCDIDNKDEDDYYQSSPAIIVEVLSKSTRKNDLSTKKLTYFNIPTLQEYVLIEQDLCEINVFRKSDDWRPSIYFLGDEISFESINTTISVEDIYYQVNNEDSVKYLKDKEEKEEDRK